MKVLTFERSVEFHVFVGNVATVDNMTSMHNGNQCSISVLFYQNQPALMSHGGHPIFTNGMMPGPLQAMNPGAPFYTASGTPAVLSDAGGHVEGSWENQHLKLPGGAGVPLAEHHVVSAFMCY